jgi:mannose-6-phosphate isomerase-like protein (cupin superfamily)
MEKVNLAKKFGAFDEQWSPKIVGELNGQCVKIAKVQGEFVWHHHDVEDEMFMVIKGRLTIKLPDRDVTLEAGEFLIVPHGVEHKPVAEEEAHILLFEPQATLNTGNVRNERTVEAPEVI